MHGDKCIFLEGDETLSTSEEDEANAFAANILIPPEHEEELLSLRVNGIAVMRFARRIGISPGIVVGQLQHRGIIARNQLTKLKRRYAWRND
jgi:Zn-dependent peptidase ImmA (M78 family)